MAVCKGELIDSFWIYGGSKVRFILLLKTRSKARFIQAILDIFGGCLLGHSFLVFVNFVRLICFAL